MKNCSNHAGVLFGNRADSCKKPSGGGGGGGGVGGGGF